MALIIEDGSGKTDSNSYATVAELDSYAALRGITLTAADDAAKEVLLIKAMDYLESLQGSYKGIKSNQYQSLQWPRYNVWIDSYYINSDSIPKDMVSAQLIAAVIVDGGGKLQPTVAPKVLSERIDTLAVTYSDSSMSNTLYPQLTSAIGPLVDGGMGLSVVRG